MSQKDKASTTSPEATPETDISRRNFFRLTAGLGGMALLGASKLATAAASGKVELPFVNGERPLAVYPQKRPMILLASRPVLLETPFHIFNNSIFTPNDAFFVRWHLANVPMSMDANTFKINVRGRVRKTLALTVADLKKNFEPVEVAAVCECSGNSRGFFNPRVPGGQWANGAMGNALWKGVRLRDVLNQAGLESDALQVRFNGAEGPVLASTPDFMKSLDIDHALSEDVIIAYSMNGEPLPLLNGFPVRLVVPGYYATYWVKMLQDIEVLSQVDQNFWMKTAYRIPDNACACMLPTDQNVKTIPINRLSIRSFITSVENNAKIHSQQPQVIKGIAFDSGFGIKQVLFSSDGGKNWTEAELGKDYGKYSFRPWQAVLKPKRGQSYNLMSLAMNQIGQTQPFTPSWNPAGFMRNVVETVQVKAI